MTATPTVLLMGSKPHEGDKLAAEWERHAHLRDDLFRLRIRNMAIIWLGRGCFRNGYIYAQKHRSLSRIKPGRPMRPLFGFGLLQLSSCWTSLCLR